MMVPTSKRKHVQNGKKIKPEGIRTKNEEGAVE
jgi:hypothetical protein